MFQPNDYVFYESGGICKIADIQTSPLSGMPPDRKYYILTSVHDKNGVMYIPVDSENIFLRPLLSRTEAEALVEQIPSVVVFEEPTAKLLRTRYLEAMRTHLPVEWVRVIKTVFARTKNCVNRNQRVSDSERAFAESAKRYLYAELSLALELSEGEIEQHLAPRLQKMA
ncbi:MAG: hypothetical protein IKC31_05155 [Clostridia bacterium]|nr:hypothetical protein [Clostridia bacterium]MBR2926944.1 hypothetical protein [Clostridia bacterium]